MMYVNTTIQGSPQHRGYWWVWLGAEFVTIIILFKPNYNVYVALKACRLGGGRGHYAKGLKELENADMHVQMSNRIEETFNIHIMYCVLLLYSILNTFQYMVHCLC